MPTFIIAHCCSLQSSHLLSCAVGPLLETLLNLTFCSCV